MEDRIVHRGKEFTIEWFYSTNGKSQALEYFNELDEARQDKAMALFVLMAEMGKIHNKTKFRYEGDGIYAFKPQPDRFLCFFFSGKKIIICNAFEKKQDKLPAEEKRRALSYKKEYQEKNAVRKLL